MPCMIWCAIVVELALSIVYHHNWPDFAVLMGLQFINGTLSFYEANKAGNAVAALKASLKPNAVCKRDGKWDNMDAATLVPGDLVMLGAGAAVPADCVVNAGRIEVDQAALTGESLPVTMVTGSKPKMGSTVTRGEIEATVEFTGKNTFFGKTAAMIASVEEMSHFTKVLLRIMAFLISISLVLCFTVLGFLMNTEKQDFPDAISFTVVLLVASIPMAMEVVTTTTMAIGSHTLSHAGAIVARLSSIEELAGMNMLCSDKTGTLTLNKMVIQDETPLFQDGLTQREVLKYAALAAKWHEPPKDALDTLVLGAVDRTLLDQYEMIDYSPFDPILKRTEGVLKTIATGELFKTTKGAAHVIAGLVKGPEAKKLHDDVMKLVDDFAERGIRSLAVARTTSTTYKDEENKGVDTWQMLGLLTFLDPPRPDTKSTLHKAMEFGIEVKMITGDHTAIAKETARVLGLGTNILKADGLPNLDKDGKPPADLEKYIPIIMEADGFAQVFPEHKFLIVEALRRKGFSCGMTGDGVNDAPALKKADIGIAVQGATDAARAAADIVLTHPGLSVIIEAITISRCIFQRIQNFVLYRVACTLQLLVFFFVAVIAFQPSRYAMGLRSFPKKGVSDNIVLAEFGVDGGKPGGALVMWQNSYCLPKTIDCNTPANLFNNMAHTNPWYGSIATSASTTGSTPFPTTSNSVCAWNLTDIAAAVGSTGTPGKEGGYGTAYIGSYLSSPALNSWEPFDARAANMYVFPATAGFAPQVIAVGDVCIEQWPRTFAIPVIALIFITLLNDGTIISIAYDHVEPSKFPEKWNLPVSYIISGVLGGVAFAGSILYLHLMLDSHNANGAWRRWGLGPLLYGHCAASIYLKVSLSDFLTLFSARTVSWFGSVKPDPKLVIAAFFALGSSTILTSQWPTPLNEKPLDDLSNKSGQKKFLSYVVSSVAGVCSGSQPSIPQASGGYKYDFCQAGGQEGLKTTQSDLLAFYSGTRMNGVPDYVLGVTWLYVFIWWIAQDIVKVLLYKFLQKVGLIETRSLMAASDVGAKGMSAEDYHAQVAGGGPQNTAAAEEPAPHATH